MNNKQLRNYRKNFYTKLEEFIQNNNSLSMEDFYVILVKSISEAKTTDDLSKKILVHIGSYVHKKERNREIEYLTYDDNPEVTYKLYKNVETGFVYKIDAKNVQKFEQKYKILFPTVNIYNVQEYNTQYEKIKLEYYKRLIYDSQKSTYKIMKKENKNI